MKISLRGFTLIELLIVITIIGILAVALIPRVAEGPAKARDTKRISDLANLTTSIELYYSDYGEYPNSGSFTAPEGDCIEPTSGIGALLLEYMQDIPQDPGTPGYSLCSAEYYYRVMPNQTGGTSPTSFMLIADMELDDNYENAISDGFYCDLGTPLIWSSYDATSTKLNLPASVCGTGEDAWYVILR